jgi:oligopeptide transport system substrate-binding protein
MPGRSRGAVSDCIVPRKSASLQFRFRNSAKRTGLRVLKAIQIICALVLAGSILVELATTVNRTAGGSGPMLSAANRNKILLLTVGSEPKTLDPAITDTDPEGKIEEAIFEGLVITDPKDGYKQIPAVAESWEHNDDYSVWIFHLRANAKWSNGDPVTAQDFAFSIKRVLTASLGAPFSEYFSVIKGAKEYLAGETADFDQVGVKVLDPRTLRFDLVGPDPYFTALLTLQPFQPVHPPTILKFGKIGQRDTRWIEPRNFVGNGPFVLKSWRENDVIEVVKSPTYWDAERVKLNGINFYSIESYDTTERAFRAGQLHKTEFLPLGKIPYFRRTEPEVLRIAPYLAVYFYILNVEHKPLDNPKVRLALNLAVDRESLVRNVLRGSEQAATGFIPPGLSEYPTTQQVAYNPEQARKLLAEAGYANGHGFPKLKIFTNTGEHHRLIAEAIQQMWRQELNIAIGLENQEWKVYLDTLIKKRFDIGRRGWVGIPDPAFFLKIWTAANVNNSSGWASVRYDSLLAKADRTGDLNERLTLYHQAEDLLLSESVMIPIFWYTSNHLVHPSVTGWYPNIVDDHPYKFIDLKPLEETPDTRLSKNP